MTSDTAARRQQRTLLACDLDGTLTFRARRPAPVVIAALRTLCRRPDIRVVIATARSPRCVRRWFPDLPGITMVCCNGALPIDPSGRPRPTFLPAEDLREFLLRIERVGVAYCLEYGETSVVSAAGALPWMRHPDRGVLADGVVSAELTGVVKCTIDDACVAQAAARDLAGISVVAHLTGDADAMATGVCKGTAVSRLRARDEALIAFGNDRNDLELLTGADRAFVVGNGLAEVDGHDHVSRVAADPGAVAEALRTLASTPIAPVSPNSSQSPNLRRRRAIPRTCDHRQPIPVVTGKENLVRTR